MTSEYLDSTAGDLAPLARFVADAKANKPEAWRRVELLQSACALALLAAEAQGSTASRYVAASPVSLPVP